MDTRIIKNQLKPKTEQSQTSIVSTVPTGRNSLGGGINQEEGKMSIKEMSTDQLVDNGDGGYSIVTRCIHGNPYYAYRGVEEDILRHELHTQEELDKAAACPDDIELNLIPCCA